jgi:uncharacterized protein YciW
MSKDRTPVAEKPALRPWQVIELDATALRKNGFSDTDILDINQITGYYAYLNRLAAGLGVELEDFWHAADEFAHEE